MNTSIVITVSANTGYYNCSHIDILGNEGHNFGRFLVPNAELGNFVSLALWLARNSYNELGELNADYFRKASESLAEEADKLCAAANVIY